MNIESQEEQDKWDAMIDDDFGEMVRMLKDIREQLRKYPHIEAMAYYKTMKGVIFNSAIILHEIKNKRHGEADDILSKLTNS